MTTIRAETEQIKENTDIWVWVDNKPTVHISLYKAKKPDEGDKVYLTVWQKNIDATNIYP